MSTPRSITEIGELTREYAAYAKSHSGLGNVLGGVVGLALCVIVTLVPPGTVASVLAVALALAWLVGKEWIRRRLYRGFGEAREIAQAQHVREHRVNATAITIGMGALGIVVLVTGGLERLDGWVLLAASLITPLVAWRYLHTTQEMGVGFGVLYFTAVVLTGFGPGLYLLPFFFVPFYSVALIPLGLKEHRRFKILAARLQGNEV